MVSCVSCSLTKMSAGLIIVNSGEPAKTAAKSPNLGARLGEGHFQALVQGIRKIWSEIESAKGSDAPCEKVLAKTIHLCFLLATLFQHFVPVCTRGKLICWPLKVFWPGNVRRLPNNRWVPFPITLMHIVKLPWVTRFVKMASKNLVWWCVYCLFPGKCSQLRRSTISPGTLSHKMMMKHRLRRLLFYCTKNDSLLLKTCTKMQLIHHYFCYQ